MIEIEDKIVSDYILEEYFACDICKCKGACCIHGDAGAPLTIEEIDIIEEDIDIIKKYMTADGIKSIEEKGVFDIDIDGDYTTTLVDGKQCAFVVEDNGIALCAIEKAYRTNEIKFKKPISCHLYPIRAKEFSNGTTGLNYHVWSICEDAIINGKNSNTKVYQGVREAIERAYGAEFYSHLEEVDRIITASEIEEI